jgi:hypothetical protein
MGLAGGESVWSDPSWLDEPSPETPWLANERYATVATRMEFQRSKGCFLDSRVVYRPVEKGCVRKIPTPVNNRATQKRPWELIELWWHLDSPTRKTHFPCVFEGFKARVSRVSSRRVAYGETAADPWVFQ